MSPPTPESPSGQVSGILNAPEALHEILDALPACICIKNQEGRFVYVNKADAALYNATPAELVGNTIEPWEGRARFLHWTEEDNAIMRAGKKVHLPLYQRVDLKGNKHWFETVKIPLKNEASEFDRLLVIHRDITEIIESERSRKELLSRLQNGRRLQELGRISTGVAHEFNNLLTPLMFQLGEIEKELKDCQHVEELMSPAKQAVIQAGEICNRLLHLGHSDKQNELLVLNEVLRSTVQFILDADDHRIQVDYQLAENLPPLRANRTAISEVLLNLCNNALHALKEKMRHSPDDWLPTLTIRSRLQTADRSHESEDALCFEVADNGSGMDPEVRDRVFQAFFTTKGHGAGSGLGLSLSWTLIREMGGRIHLQSTPGSGTTFVVTLPLQNDETEPKKKSDKIAGDPPAEQGEVKPLQIVVVDDSKPVREIIARFLEKNGHRVTEFQDGLQAWQNLASDHSDVDLVLADQNMPGLCGVDLVQRLHEIHFGGHIAVISGYLSDEDHRVFEACGVFRILMKPFTSSALMDLIRDLPQRKN